ncbi:MAG TPA: hypothetical protein VMT79_13145 [Candidatus Binatia bacterium]|nr:hypothetical protein [Candidatus Binatia bacterium]
MATQPITDVAIILNPQDDVAIATRAISAGSVLEDGACRIETRQDIPVGLEEDMDINCGVILEGTPLHEVGRRIFEEIVAVASGKRSKSELSGVGEEEFAPWIIGPVM